MYEIHRSPTLTERQLHSLFEASWPRYRRRRFASVLDHSFEYFGAFAGAELVGFVNVAWDGGDHAFILDTTVHPGFRRRGIALALLSRAAAAARERGIEWLHVDFEPELEALYRKAGFRPTAAGLLRVDEHPSVSRAAITSGRGS